MLPKSRSHCLVRHKDGRQCRAAEGQDRVRQGQDLQSSAKLRCKAWGLGSVYSVCRLLASKTVMAMANARQTAAQKADAPTMPQPRSHWSHCRRRGPMIMISSSRLHSHLLHSLHWLHSRSWPGRAMKAPRCSSEGGRPRGYSKGNVWLKSPNARAVRAGSAPFLLRSMSMNQSGLGRKIWLFCSLQKISLSRPRSRSTWA